MNSDGRDKEETSARVLQMGCAAVWSHRPWHVRQATVCVSGEEVTNMCVVHLEWGFAAGGVTGLQAGLSSQFKTSANHNSSS